MTSSSSDSKQNEDQDNVNYDELPDCIGLEKMHSGYTYCEGECIEQNSQNSNNTDSIPNNYSALRSTFSCQRFMR